MENMTDEMTGLIKKAKRLSRRHEALPAYSSKREGLSKRIQDLDREIVKLRKKALEQQGQLTIL